MPDDDIPLSRMESGVAIGINRRTCINGIGGVGRMSRVGGKGEKCFAPAAPSITLLRHRRNHRFAPALLPNGL